MLNLNIYDKKTYLSKPTTVKVYTETETDTCCMNCTTGQNSGTNIHLPSIKSVYVNGMEKIAIVTSERAKLIRNNRMERRLLKRTAMAAAFPPKANKAVQLYKMITKFCMFVSKIAMEA